MIDIQHHIAIERELTLLMKVEKIETGVYFLTTGQDKASLSTSKYPFALLPFCIKHPNCKFRRETDCNFSESLCCSDQTKFICGILKEYNIPYCFNNYFLDVIKNVKKISLED